MGDDKGGVHWNPLFVRHDQDWELEMFSSFFQLLYSIRFVWDLRIRCTGNITEMSVILAVHTMRIDALTGSTMSDFPWKAIWRVKAHTKVCKRNQMGWPLT